MLEKIEKIDKCPTCGAKIKGVSNSLHVWECNFDCGCVIWGGIGAPAYEIQIECPYNIKNKNI